ncbi:MAG TPA: prolyl oligopeptidase family serine peptidase, partial [Pyrinomonadaceae bacterium]
MVGPKISPYGTWKSPITSDLIASSAIGLSQPRIAGDDIYWIEMRPEEGGRNVIVRQDAFGQVSDVNPPPFNARTRVHEYGGGDYVIHQNAVYFSNFADQRLYVKTDDSSPRPITAPTTSRYADPIVDAKRKRLICVREDHRAPGVEAVNSLVSLNLDQNEDSGTVIVSGNDFYSNPRLSPEGNSLAWLTWNHPNMPWDGCELWAADLATDGSITGKRVVAGGLTESIFQPEWSPGGVLYFVSDRSGWWNIYRVSRNNDVEVVLEKNAEFGTPQWVFGLTTYAFDSADQIICTFSENGIWHLGTIDVITGKMDRVASSYTDISYVTASGGRAVLRAGSPSQSPAIVAMNVAERTFRVLRRSNDLRIDPSFISAGRAIEFPTSNGRTAHAFFYPPKSRDFIAPEGELPPLLVKSHGGPTSAAATALSLNIQYWTSRGIAVLDVNYGGSSGYGRDYRERLKDQWGVVDVDDCVNGARYLMQRGEVDGNRLMITGGSAGGYTTLCALTFHDEFKAGASHFG